MFSIFALTAFLKAAMQKFIGFDRGEQLWLNRGGALTHLIAIVEHVIFHSLPMPEISVPTWDVPGLFSPLLPAISNPNH